MNIQKAFILSLGKLSLPVITHYQMGVIVYHLYKSKTFGSEQIDGLLKPSPNIADLSKLRNKLVADGVLALVPGFHHIYSLVGHPKSSVEDIACTIDPFAYVSHLSAMDYHGLTDRIPAKLYLSTPDPKQWKRFAEGKMQSDLTEELPTYLANGLPSLAPATIKKIARTEIHQHRSVHQGTFKNVADHPMRVSTIGRTFLDMLRAPEICGGINHVLQVYEQHAPIYINLIADEINQHGNAIDRVRSGYILEERLALKHPSFAEWQKSAQRGGSRKLVASAEYLPRYSERWCISINIIE